MQLKIATRESRLALWQAQHVAALLEQQGHSCELVPMTTKGDQILDRSLSKIGGKGLFIKELEQALQDGRAHLAVHSLKDVPMDLPDGFALPCVLQRANMRDAFVSNTYASMNDLPKGAVVGTSSLRRTALLQALRPDLDIQPLRGNLDTRLSKLDAGQYDAIVLAAVGLKRLGLADRVRHEMATEQMLPAAGQGGLAIETLDGAVDVQSVLMPLHHPASHLVAEAERAVSRCMQGGCSVPLAAFATLDGQNMHLQAAWGQASKAESYQLLRAESHVQLPAADHEDQVIAARQLGERVAQMLKDQGATIG